MHDIDYAHGNYQVDGETFEFVKHMSTGLCYGFVEGEIDFSESYRGLHNLLKERHPGTTKSGNVRAFSVKSRIRILGEYLHVWEKRGASFVCLIFALFPSIRRD